MKGWMVLGRERERGKTWSRKKAGWAGGLVGSLGTTMGEESEEKDDKVNPGAWIM